MWLADGGQRLNPKTFAIVADPMNDRVVSDVSLWEIAIKRSTGKLIVNKHDIDQALEEMAVEELPISRQHVQSVSSLPLHHRDPFDRLLIAQAKAENLVIVSNDPYFATYGTRMLPA